MDAQRFHLTLSRTGRPVMHGWWADEKVARAKFTSWIGEFSKKPGARVVLVDEAEARTLDSWPDET
jgi:hypothetical protein